MSERVVMSTDIDIDLLISLVHERPELCDRSLEVYKDKNKARDSWRQICTILNPKFEELGESEVDFSSLEYAGFLTGFRIIERLTKDWPRFKDELETLKFICTDFWSSVYKKQIDNLRTNHQGVYVLQDNAFRFLSKISCGTQYLECAPRYVAFTCGLLRGALANLGIVSLVTAEIQPMPAVKFHIEVKRT